MCHVSPLTLFKALHYSGGPQEVSVSLETQNTHLALSFVSFSTLASLPGPAMMQL